MRLPTASPAFSRRLKKSLFSPAQPRRAETRLFPCFVLGSSKFSTGTGRFTNSAARTDLVLLIRRTVRPSGYVCGPLLTRCGLAWLGQGVSQGNESVLADSGRVGEITARVGRVRSLAFLSTLRECSAVVPL